MRRVLLSKIQKTTSCDISRRIITASYAYSRHEPPSITTQSRANASVRIKKDDATSTYERLLQRLYQVNRFTSVKLGINNMHQLNEAFGNPASQLDIVHVAGTNGKGSVSYKIAKALECAGYRTGLFVSPHVSCFRERIQINGKLISEAQVNEHLDEIFNLSAQLRIPATFFEITTMLALKHFAKQQVDCVVLETGLGGRLDATNIVTPTLSVITSIGLDHMRILGNSIESIAHEKAGIIKSRVPVVLGPHVPLDIMQMHANKHQSSLIQVNMTRVFENDFNAENTAIARESCVQLNDLATKSRLQVDIDNSRITNALQARPPCRFQVLDLEQPNSTKKVTIVLDVAHNAPAMESLVRSLRNQFPIQNFRIVCGFSADKDVKQVLTTLSSLSKETTPYIHLVQANHPRAASLEEINDTLVGSKFSFFAKISSISDGVNDAIAAARIAEKEEVVVVCGSVFLMAEARQVLGFNGPIDSPTLTAAAGSHLSTPESRRAPSRDRDESDSNQV